ncbi:hypothetical protein [Burkholderia ubonensis]|uniref:hypothetical protein n=1 Tax=Burkholderia ubonensis TaxID=101571 RepID=UPI0012F8C346|nr:hypothetical protein [Burkholderia ubonensis]
MNFLENYFIAISYFRNNSQMLFPFIFLESDRTGDHGSRLVQGNRLTQAALLQRRNVFPADRRAIDHG